MVKSERGRIQIESNRSNRTSRVKYIYVCVQLVVEIQWIGLLSILNLRKYKFIQR